MFLLHMIIASCLDLGLQRKEAGQFVCFFRHFP